MSRAIAVFVLKHQQKPEPNSLVEETIDTNDQFESFAFSNDVLQFMLFFVWRAKRSTIIDTEYENRLIRTFKLYLFSDFGSSLSTCSFRMFDDITFHWTCLLKPQIRLTSDRTAEKTKALWKWKYPW